LWQGEYSLFIQKSNFNYNLMLKGCFREYFTPKENLLECEVLDSSILGGKQKTLREYAEGNLKLKKFRELNFGNNGFSKADHPQRVYDEFIKEDFIPGDR